ncbi:uncharacterized protein EV420DRAFT_1316019 [Desarmillaria tabescens]|uniref:Peptidase C14 caspase domain-containing protein n=1 Tax=Armillaria tabescens TaxID=1929756 RepID=A0AA39MNJ2_ARMTA|nr:uncharacterized protein EV420DRAFT_1316019 [Desarmillaria tabescens]KAK0439940.1 hypothetical protein EV420DRAFT_1316019 [Desarmillaria tabescens]
MQSEEIDSPVILQKAKDVILSTDEGPLEIKDKPVQTAVFLDSLYKLRRSLSELRLFRIVSDLQACELEPANNPFPSAIDASRFWVVIIGIDAYRQLPLQGCVFDAITMEKYCIDLGVLKCRIQLLLGRLDGLTHSDSLFPSRENIIKTLHDIRSNCLVEKGDSIIIYFSGHGSHYFCSNYFQDNIGASAHLGSIEAIYPADRNELDTDGRPISDISDREINTIISLIRDTKGDHITLILDCCHSGSATRNISAFCSPGHTRDLPPVSHRQESVFESADKSLQKHCPGAPSVLVEDRSPDMTSHVVIAACREFEFVREVRSNDGNITGIFTNALVSTLRSDLCQS